MFAKNNKNRRIFSFEGVKPWEKQVFPPDGKNHGKTGFSPDGKNHGKNR